MKKFLNNVKSGFLLFLPIVLFFLIIWWIFKLLISSVSWIIDLLPSNIQVLPNIVLDLISLIILIGILWLIGAIINHYLIGEKIKKLLRPIIGKIPLLNTLYEIVNQLKDTLKNKSAFKDVAIIEYPSPGIFSLCFITNELSDTYVIFVASVPNPTNGTSIVRQKKDVIILGMTIKEGIQYIATFGAAVSQENKKKIEKGIKKLQEST